MKVIGHSLGRVVILFPTEEIRPIQGIPLVDAISSVRERYAFLHVPDLNMPVSQLEQEGYHFSEGQLLHDGEQHVIKEFSLYNGAISVGSYVTDTADLFMDDFIEWAQEEFHIRPFVRTPKKIYTSQVTVGFAKPLSRMLKGFSKFSTVLSEALEAHTEASKAVDLVRIGWGIDQSAVGANNIVHLSLERRTQISFEEEWYFSEAPLPSGVHVRLLEELETSIVAQ